MSRLPKTPSDDVRGSGFEEAPAVAWSEDETAETLAALKEYRRTGESYSIDESMAELDRLIAERKARRA